MTDTSDCRHRDINENTKWRVSSEPNRSQHKINYEAPRITPKLNGTDHDMDYIVAGNSSIFRFNSSKNDHDSSILNGHFPHPTCRNDLDRNSIVKMTSVVGRAPNSSAARFWKSSHHFGPSEKAPYVPLHSKHLTSSLNRNSDWAAFARV